MSCVSRGGFGRGSLVVCAVMVSIFLSYLYSWCCAEGAAGSPWALSVSTGVKPVPRGDGREGALTWQSKGCRGKGCALAMSECLRWLMEQEQAAALIHQPWDRLHSWVSLLPGQAPAGWHLAKGPRAACPRAVDVRLAFPGLVEVPLLQHQGNKVETRLCVGLCLDSCPSRNPVKTY